MSACVRLRQYAGPQSTRLVLELLVRCVRDIYYSPWRGRVRTSLLGTPSCLLLLGPKPQDASNLCLWVATLMEGNVNIPGLPIAECISKSHTRPNHLHPPAASSREGNNFPCLSTTSRAARSILTGFSQTRFGCGFGFVTVCASCAVMVAHFTDSVMHAECCDMLAGRTFTLEWSLRTPSTV